MIQSYQPINMTMGSAVPSLNIQEQLFNLVISEIGNLMASQQWHGAEKTGCGQSSVVHSLFSWDFLG